MLKRRLLHVPKLWFIVYIDGIIRNLYNTSLGYVLYNVFLFLFVLLFQCGIMYTVS